MQIGWYIVYMTVAIFLIVLLPFGIFFYESDPEKNFVSNDNSKYFEEITNGALNNNDNSFDNNIVPAHFLFICGIEICKDPC